MSRIYLEGDRSLWAEEIACEMVQWRERTQPLTGSDRSQIRARMGMVCSMVIPGFASNFSFPYCPVKSYKKKKKNLITLGTELKHTLYLITFNPLAKIFVE